MDQDRRSLDFLVSISYYLVLLTTLVTNIAGLLIFSVLYFYRWSIQTLSYYSIFSKAGLGLGGLFGLPIIAYNLAFLMLIPIIYLAIRDYISGINQDQAILYIKLSVLTFLIGFVYLIVAHLIDPCTLGLLDTSVVLARSPLCEQFGDGTNVYRGFHTLFHVLIATPMVLFYRYWVNSQKLWDFRL